MFAHYGDDNSVILLETRSAHHSKKTTTMWQDRFPKILLFLTGVAGVAPILPFDAGVTTGPFTTGFTTEFQRDSERGHSSALSLAAYM